MEEERKGAYDGPADFPQSTLDLFAGGIAVGAWGAEDGAWCCRWMLGVCLLREGIGRVGGEG